MYSSSTDTMGLPRTDCECPPLPPPLLLTVVGMQVTVDAQQELAQLEEELDKAYSCGHLCIMGMPVVNKWACAWFEDDDKVYRAKITSESIMCATFMCCHGECVVMVIMCYIM